MKKHLSHEGEFVKTGGSEIFIIFWRDVSSRMGSLKIKLSLETMVSELK